MQVLEVLSGATPIRQGDVVSYRSSAGGPYGAQSAVVLTADCDLAQSKHYGQLLLCPIVPIQALLHGPWSLRRLQRLRASTEQRIRQDLERLLNAGLGTLSESTVTTLIASTDAMKSALSGVAGVPDGDKQKLLRLTEVCVAAESDEAGALKALVTAYAIRDGSSQEKARTKVLQEFKDEMKGDNADVVVLPDEMKGGNAACVILLRCPFSVSVSDVSLSTTIDSQLLREGRLCAALKYLVAQKFGLLFSRFGMPKQIEDDRNMAVDIEEMVV